MHIYVQEKKAEAKDGPKGSGKTLKKKTLRKKNTQKKHSGEEGGCQGRPERIRKNTQQSPGVAILQVVPGLP